jgi:hypothetical protein
MIGSVTSEQSLSTGWVLWLLSWASVLAGRLLGALIQNPVAGVGHGFERNPEVAALTAEIGRLEREAKALCRPDSFVAYAKLERELDDKKQRLQELQLREQQRLLAERAVGLRHWRRRLSGWVALLSTLSWLVVPSALWFIYRNHIVLYFPCSSRLWRLFRILHIDSPTDQNGKAPSLCALRGGPWLWLSTLAARYFLGRGARNLVQTRGIASRS